MRILIVGFIGFLIQSNPTIYFKEPLNFDAEIYINWIISDSAKILINNFKKNGQQLFFFNHH